VARLGRERWSRRGRRVRRAPFLIPHQAGNFIIAPSTAISFFTQNVPGKYDDIPLGQQISSLAYQWFVGCYGYP
jgi:hypothetical protein